jgi:hypothetical protein
MIRMNPAHDTVNPAGQSVNQNTSTNVTPVANQEKALIAEIDAYIERYYQQYPDIREDYPPSRMERIYINQGLIDQGMS